MRREVVLPRVCHRSAVLMLGVSSSWHWDKVNVLNRPTEVGGPSRAPDAFEQVSLCSPSPSSRPARIDFWGVFGLVIS